MPEAIPTPNASTAFNDATIGVTQDSQGVIVILAPQGSGKVEFMHKKLPASHSRMYEVYAVNSVGISTNASAVAPIPQTAAAGKPGKPTLRLVPYDDYDGVRMRIRCALMARPSYIGHGPTTAARISTGGSCNGRKAPANGWKLTVMTLTPMMMPPTMISAHWPGPRVLRTRFTNGSPGRIRHWPDAATFANRSVSKTTRFQVRANNGSLMAPGPTPSPSPSSQHLSWT